MKTSHILTAAIILTIANTSQADILWTGSFRFYSTQVLLNETSSDAHLSTGTWNTANSVMSENSFGVSTSSIDIESTILNDTFDVSTSFNLQSSSLSPLVEQNAGGALLSISQFVLTESTTLEFSLTIDSQSDLNNFASFSLSGNGTGILDVHQEETGNYIFIQSLDAGTYYFDHASSMRAPNENAAGNWSFSSNLSITVIPAPSSLFLLAASPLICIPRRRPK